MNKDELYKDLDGIVVPGGFGSRGVEGKIRTIQYARENNIPYLGLCLGMQSAVMEFARNVCGLEGATSSEFDEEAHQIIKKVWFNSGKTIAKYFNEKEKVWKLCSTYVLFIHWIIPVYAYAYG